MMTVLRSPLMASPSGPGPSRPGPAITFLTNGLFIFVFLSPSGLWYGQADPPGGEVGTRDLGPQG